MFTIVADVAVLAAVGYCIMLGHARGLRAATVVSLELFFALSATLLVAPMLASMLTPVLAGIGGRDFDAAPWSMLIASLVSFGLVIAVLQAAVPRRLVFKTEDDDSFDEEKLSQPQKIGGAVMGGVAGLLGVGTVLILLSMVPWAAESRFRSTAMLYDIGALCLRAFAHVADWGHGGRSVVVYGEPVSDKAVPEARLSSESYADIDGNGKFSEGDVLYDADASGHHAADLYYLDLDDDGARRPGMLEHYVIGNWAAIPTISDRARPGAAPPPPPPSEDEEAAAAASTPDKPASPQAGSQQPKTTPNLPVPPPPVPATPTPPPPPPGDDF